MSNLNEHQFHKVITEVPQFDDWDSVTQLHPEMAEHEDVVNLLANAHPEDPYAEGGHVYGLAFRHEQVDPSLIRYNRAGASDPRTTSARQGYLRGADVPPLLLVKRGKKYDVADGHHRAEAAHGLQRGGRLSTVPAVVTNRAVRARLP